MIRVALLCALTFALQAQEFEAASIRPPSDAPSRCSGGPGTQDPGRFTCENYSLAYLAMMAYNVRPYQFSAPDWTRMTRFNVQATLPPNSGVEQFRAMLQNLLAERFKLTVHHDRKEMDGYDLVVVKPSSNLRPAAEAPPVPASPWTNPFGGPPVRAKALFTGRSASMGVVALFASDRLNRPITDTTGLSGHYDFELMYSDAPPGPSVVADDDSVLGIESALREQLGLGLIKKKMQVDLVIVDHIEKTPAEN